MASGYEFHLNVIGPDFSQVFAIPVGVSTIGRQAGETLFLDNPLVSRRHLRITCTLNEVRVTDLNSSNGTYINTEKLAPGTPRTLEPGNVIHIGPFDLTFERIPLPEPAPAEEPVLEDFAEVITPPAELPPVIVQAVVQSPPPPTPPPAEPPEEPAPAPESPIPSGLTLESQRLIRFLPGIYDTDFMRRFLGLFESILTPIEWNIDNFDLFLDPRTAPADFLPWLAAWFELVLQPGWTERQRRELLDNAGFFYARRGTRLALTRLLEIFIQKPVAIDDTSADLPPYTFRVRLPLRKDETDPAMLQALIDAHKPAHTLYRLEYAK